MLLGVNLDNSERLAFEIDALLHLLESEYNHLKNNEIAKFEKLQSRKQELLSFIIEQSDYYKNLNPESDLDIFQRKDINDKINKCNNLQKRNEILINGKLSAINDALHSLGLKPYRSRETYEHLASRKKN